MKVETVLVTGTTRGVGRALLQLYAERGANVIAVNRRRVPELEALFPRVRFECLDVSSAPAVAALLRQLADSAQLPDLFVLNVGINQIDNDEVFDLSAYRSTMETNLYGTLNFVEPLTQLAPGGAPRHVIAISSMAKYVGNPYGLGYSTSKMALTACFEAWSQMYSGTDLVFQRVMLGPVDTAMYAMHDRFPGWMVRIKKLFSVSPDETAHAVARLAATRRRKVFYPRRAIPLYLAMWLARCLIPGFFRGRKTLSGQARRQAAPSREVVR